MQDCDKMRDKSNCLIEIRPRGNSWQRKKMGKINKDVNCSQIQKL